MVWGISQNMLHCEVVSKDRRFDLSGDFSPLDQKLLLVLQSEKSKLKDIAAVGIVADHLGGFASSRLLLATLNTYAWLRDMPIFSIPEEWKQKEPAELVMLLLKKSKATKKAAQVLPQYMRPADTTESKKVKKFKVV